MPQLKRFFIIPFIMYVSLTTIIGIVQLFSGSLQAISSLGVVLAAGAPCVFFMYLIFGRTARTNAHPLAITLLSAAGVVLTMLPSQHTSQEPGLQFWLAAVAFVGWYIYLRWYSRLPSAQASELV